MYVCLPPIFLLFPLPLRPFKQTLISSFLCALCLRRTFACLLRSVTASPNLVPASFPMDLLENQEMHGGPNILVTAPGSSHSPVSSANPVTNGGANPTHLPALSLPGVNTHNYTLSPGSSPTNSEFPVHQNSPHNLSRQSSFNFDGRYDHASLPPSPRPGQPGQVGDDRVKRQRMSPVDSAPMGPSIAGGNPNANGEDPGKKLSRARSDSAPMGGGGPGFFGQVNSNGGLAGFPYNSGVPTRARGLSSGGRGKNNTGY